MGGGGTHLLAIAWYAIMPRDHMSAGRLKDRAKTSGAMNAGVPCAKQSQDEVARPASVLTTECMGDKGYLTNCIFNSDEEMYTPCTSYGHTLEQVRLP